MEDIQKFIETIYFNFFPALRTTQGFFLNGEWTASPTGQYGAAGTVFNYQHVINGNSLRRHGERVTAKGPLTSDIDIIVSVKVTEYLQSSELGRRSPKVGQLRNRRGYCNVCSVQPTFSHVTTSDITRKL